MSEKRFRAEVDDRGHLKIITNGETVLNDSYEVVDLLNKLYDENEQLKKENIEYKEIINFCTNDGDDALVKVIRENVKLQNELDKLKFYEPIDKDVNDVEHKLNEQQATISKLEEENEALKKFIKDNFNKMMDSKMVVDDEL